MNERKNIDLMVKHILQEESMPDIFDPYNNECDVMLLWDRFSLGYTTELYSYPHSNDWCAKRDEKNGDYIIAESADRKDAMCRCMVKYAKTVNTKFTEMNI